MGESKAFWSTLLFITSLHVQIQFKLSVPDPFLICFLAFSIFSFESWIRTEMRSKKNLRWAYFFLALATLSKGPIALVLIAGTLITYFLATQNRFRILWSRIFDPSSIGIFFAVTLPWYVAVFYATEGAWLQEFIFHHNLDRFAKPMEGHGGPFYLTLLMVIVGFLPGSLFLNRIFAYRVKDLFGDPLLGLSCIFTLVTLVFFSLSSTKLPNYAAPVYPFLAVIFAYTLDVQGINSRIRYVSFALAALVPVALLVLAYSVVPTLPELEGIEKYSPYLIVPAGLGLISLVSLSLKRVFISLFALCLAFLALNFLVFQFYLPTVNSHNPVSVSRDIWTGKKLYYWGKFNPAFPFAANQIISEWEVQSGYQDLIVTTDWALNQNPLPVPYKILFRSKDLFEKTETMIIRPISAE